MSALPSTPLSKEIFRGKKNFTSKYTALPIKVTTLLLKPRDL
jgi:hypothetical protein